MDSKIFFALMSFMCFSRLYAFRVLRGEEQPTIEKLQLTNYFELITAAAKTGESVMVELLGDTQTVIAQHGVNIVFDCGPLIPETGKPLGSGVQWEVRDYSPNQDGLLVPRGRSYAIGHGSQGRKEVGGSLGRYFNITKSNIIQGSQDDDNGLYTCIVCTTSSCRTSSVMLYIIGSMFNLIQGEADAVPVLSRPYVDRSYNIGTNFCVEAGSDEIIELRCDAVSESANESYFLPLPSRSWQMNNTLVYSVDNIGMQPYQHLNQDFIKNSILTFGVVDPFPFYPLRDGSLYMDFTASRLSVPSLAPGSSAETIKSDVFHSLLGSWSCTVSSPIQGPVTATSVISEC